MTEARFTAHPATVWFRKLLAHPSPPRHELALAAAIRDALGSLGFAHETDAAGNVIVNLESENPERPPTVLAAHMDELGLTVTGIEADGRLRVMPAGRLDPFKIGERPLTLWGTDQTLAAASPLQPPAARPSQPKAALTGILSLGSSHQAVQNQAVSWNDARIITGLSPDALREAGIDIGAMATVSLDMRGPVFLGEADDPLMAAWTFDDRMGCVALLRLLEHLKQNAIRPKRPLTLAFTTHEEGACHGAMFLCHRLQPETFIAIDGCPITPEMPLALDGRPGIWTRDAKAIYDPALIVMFERMARDVGLTLQRAVYPNASSDASAAYSVGAVGRIAFVGHVRDNSHGFEVARFSVFDHLLSLLKRFVDVWI